DAVDVLARQIVERANNAPAATIVPIGIARSPIFDVSGKRMPAGARGIDTFIGEQILRFIRTATNPIRTVLKLQVVLADVFETAPFKKARRGRIDHGDVDRARGVSQWLGLSRRGLKFDGNPRSSAQLGLIAPLANFVGSETHSPQIASGAPCPIRIKKA